MLAMLTAAEALMHKTACNLLKLKLLAEDWEGNTEEDTDVFDILYLAQRVHFLELIIGISFAQTMEKWK